jgi:hypothetical protein
MANKTLIALATSWGPQQGGINSFNYDFLRAFGVAFHHSVRVLCVVPQATRDQIEEAGRHHVGLIPLPHPLSGETLDAVHAAEIVRCVQIAAGQEIIWLGHDRFTGAAAVEAAKQTQSAAAVIHHMSYAAYEPFKSGSAVPAKEKIDQQRNIAADGYQFSSPKPSDA